MPTGVLKTAFNDRGFAFIEGGVDADVAHDVFLHIRALVDGEDSDRYVRGARVEFDLTLVEVSGQEKPQARNVRLLGGPAAEDGSDLLETDLQGRLKFWHANGFGFLVDEASGNEYYVSATSAPGRYLRSGDIIQFDVEKRDHDRSQAVNVRVVDWAPTAEPFDDKLDMGNPRWVEQLAAEAEPEPWNYPEKPAKDAFAILRSYVKYTFLRLDELPGHVPMTADEAYLAFNTGLVTAFQEPLFALFNRRAEGELGPPWGHVGRSGVTAPV